MGNPNWIAGGKSPNPDGRPKKGTAMTDLIREMLELPGSKDGTIRKILLVDKIIEQALAGNETMQKYIIDRLDGKPTETVEVDGIATIPIVFDKVLDKGENSDK